jgi:O-antigen/teichoic acid export membrane protein
MNLLQKQGFYNSLILYAGTALGFFNLIVLFQRILTLEEIGFFTIMNTVALLYAQMASVGINNIILKFFPYYRTEDKKHGGFVVFVILWCALNFCLASVVFFLFKSTIIAHYQGNPGSVLLIRYFYLLAPLSLLTMVYTVIESMAITIFKNVLSSFLREVLLRLFTTAGILLIAAHLINYHHFLNLYFAGNAVVIIVLWYSLFKNRQFKLSKPSARLLRQRNEFLQYGFFTLLSSTSFVLIQNLDIISLSAITEDLKLVGIYSAFFSIAVVISLPAKALSRTSVQILSQAWASDDLQKIDKIYFKTSVVQMLFGCLLFVGLIVNHHFIIMLLHKPEYVNYFDVFIVVGLGFLADMTGGVNGYIINLSRYYRFTTYFIVASVIFCGVLNWILIPRIGMMGAAIAYALSMFVLNLMYWLYVKIKFKLQPFGRVHIVIFFLSTAALLAGLFVPSIANIWIDMIVRSVLVLTIFIVFTYLFKISEDINILVDRILPRKKTT